jgi:CDP-diglyceride synthetase
MLKIKEMNQEITTKQKNVRNILYLVMLLLLVFKYIFFEYLNLLPIYLTRGIEVATLVLMFLVAKKNNIINKSSSVFYIILAIVFAILFMFRNSPIGNN